MRAAVSQEAGLPAYQKCCAHPESQSGHSSYVIVMAENFTLQLK